MATGIYVALAPIGIVIGNLVSAVIVTSWGWRSVFYLFGGAGVILAILTWYVLRDHPEQLPSIAKEELELIKSSQAAFEGKAVTTSTGSTVGQLLANPWAWVISLNYFAFTLVFWANINWLPTYFMKARGSNLLKAGMNSSIPWIAMVAGLLLLGWLADKVGKKYKSNWQALSLFMMVPTISYAVITPSLTACLISFSIATFFVGGAMGLVNAINFDIFSKADVPKVSGLMVTGASIAGIIAPILVGYVLKATNSFDIAYFVFSGVAFIGGLLGLALFYKEKKLRIERQSSYVG
jgi:ACS family glucarate transporter-like MFS transporter